VAAPELTETTIRYLFATSWLPSNPEEQLVRVPGGSTTGLDTGGNLLHIAMWNLRRQGLMEFEQLREVEEERVTELGGRSFARFKLLHEELQPEPRPLRAQSRAWRTMTMKEPSSLARTDSTAKPCLAATSSDLSFQSRT
jgi:hypothetical protein